MPVAAATTATPTPIPPPTFSTLSPRLCRPRPELCLNFFSLVAKRDELEVNFLCCQFSRCVCVCVSVWPCVSECRSVCRYACVCVCVCIADSAVFCVWVITRFCVNKFPTPQEFRRRIIHSLFELTLKALDGFLPPYWNEPADGFQIEQLYIIGSKF